MKLKHSPDDFVVEELTDVFPGPAGEFGFYKLEKTGWTTPDAVAAIRRRWQLDATRLSYGGLKDRHAKTTQFLTVYRGPQRDLEHERIRLTYLGRVPEPFGPSAIRGNRFAVVLRAVTPAQRQAIDRGAAEIADVGVPNYYDDQRFGSVGGGGDFVAREMVFGRFEAALKLALAGEYEFDRAADKREKESLLKLWGDWAACKAALQRGHARSLVDYLASHPTDFRGAAGRLRPDLGGLYLSAYQSFLWNRMLAAWIASRFPAADLLPVELKMGSVPAPRAVSDCNRPGWETFVIPLPSARLKPDAATHWHAAVEGVLAAEGLTLKQLKIPGLEKPFFSRGDRAVRITPAGFAAEPAKDEKHPGKQKITLRFDLPRGCYATMVVKRLTSA